MALAFLLGLVLPAVGEIYRWKDETGTFHFTDSLHGVPPQYRNQVQSLNDRLPPLPPPRQIGLKQVDQGYLVEARVNGSTPVQLVLDTGATSTVLSTAVARRLGVQVQRDPPAVVHTANGTVEAGWAQVDEIEVGGRRAGPLRVVIHDAVTGADGLLGMNFLGAFRVEIQSTPPALILSPP